MMVYDVWLPFRFFPLKETWHVLGTRLMMWIFSGAALNDRIGFYMLFAMGSSVQISGQDGTGSEGEAEGW